MLYKTMCSDAHNSPLFPQNHKVKKKTRKGFRHWLFDKTMEFEIKSVKNTMLAMFASVVRYVLIGENWVNLRVREYRAL